MRTKHHVWLGAILFFSIYCTEGREEPSSSVYKLDQESIWNIPIPTQAFTMSRAGSEVSPTSPWARATPTPRQPIGKKKIILYIKKIISIHKKYSEGKKIYIQRGKKKKIHKPIYPTGQDQNFILTYFL
jgi:hypothetical protein